MSDILVDAADDDVGDTIAESMAPTDAALLAAAPSDLAWLLDELEAAERVIDDVHGEVQLVDCFCSGRFRCSRCKTLDALTAYDSKEPRRG